MKRLTFGSASCALFAAAALALGWMGLACLMIATTPPGGSGEFKGIDHLGWTLGVYLAVWASPFLNVVGFSLGMVGTSRGWSDRRAALAGFALNGAALLLCPFVYRWAMSFLDATR